MCRDNAFLTDESWKVQSIQSRLLLSLIALNQMGKKPVCLEETHTEEWVILAIQSPVKDIDFNYSLMMSRNSVTITQFIM